MEGITILEEKNDEVNLERIKNIIRSFEIIAFFSLMLFVLGIFILSISFLSYVENQELLIFEIPSEDFAIRLSLLSFLIGMISILILVIFNNRLENKFFVTKYPIFTNELKPKYNLKDTLFLDIETKIEIEKNRIKGTDYFLYLIYFIFSFPVLFICSSLLTAVIGLSLENGEIALIIILNILNLFGICLSIYCYFFSNSKNILLKIFRQKSLVDTLLQINKTTFISNAVIYSIIIGMTFAFFREKSGITTVNLFHFSSLFFFWTIFSIIILCFFTFIRNFRNKKIKSKILDEDYNYTKTIFSIYSDFSSLLDKEASKRILFEKFTNNMMDATLSNFLSGRYAIVLSKGFFNSILDYCDDSNNFDILKSTLKEPNQENEFSSNNYSINKIMMTSFIFYFKGKVALNDNAAEEALSYFKKAYECWSNIEHKKIRDFNLHFNINKDISNIMIVKDPIEKTNLFANVAVQYFTLSNSIWNFDYWSTILGSIYGIYYIVRLSRKGHTYDTILNADLLLENLEDLKTIDEYKEIYLISELFIESIKKYSESHFDEKEYVAESSRLRDLANELLEDSQSYIEKVFSILKESYTTTDTYKELLDSISENTKVDKTIKTKDKRPFFSIFDFVIVFLILGIGGNIAASYLYEYFVFFKSLPFIISYSVLVVIYMIVKVVLIVRDKK